MRFSFQYFSGAHNNQWTECNACHVNPDNRSQINCLTCHDHNQTDTDLVHGGMNGYAYQSSSCLQCHPTGVKGNFVDHDPQFFPIFSGKHDNKWDDCSTCHDIPGDKTAFTCFNCHEHNQTDMDNEHIGEGQGYSYDSQSCLNCHPNGTKG